MSGHAPTSHRFRANAAEALANTRQVRVLRTATARSVAGRMEALAERPDWEALRVRARAIKRDALSRLDHYLTELEARVREQGGTVAWARDAEEARRYIVDLARARGVTTAVKAKSMTSEEIDLNAAFEAAGVTPVETDLGEYIVQLARETPSHIILPAIHKSRGDVSALFERELGTAPTEDVAVLAGIARRVLRERFLTAGMGVSGANFAVAETGTLVIVENEGNIRFSTGAPRIHVALVGIEKVIPRLDDVATFLRLLPRSGTGQRITSYVNFLNGPRRPDEDDGPDELHLVLLDNGRSRILADPDARESLLCIRCGACLNVCPVYQRVGGHAYGWVYPGPLGAMITPQYLGLDRASELPFASSLCGACKDACPVRIDIPRVLLHLRQTLREPEATRTRGLAAWIEKRSVRFAAWTMKSPGRFAAAGRFLRLGLRLSALGGRAPRVPGWSKTRDFPAPARRSLRELLS
jgi:L-lactate dehydrogenase complex protein LldF